MGECELSEFTFRETVALRLRDISHISQEPEGLVGARNFAIKIIYTGRPNTRIEGYVGRPDLWAIGAQTGSKWPKMAQTAQDNLKGPKWSKSLGYQLCHQNYSSNLFGTPCLQCDNVLGTSNFMNLHVFVLALSL